MNCKLHLQVKFFEWAQWSTIDLAVIVTQKPLPQYAPSAGGVNVIGMPLRVY